MALQPKAWDLEFSNEATIEVAIDLSSRHVSRIDDPETRSALEKALADRRFADLVNWDVDYSGRHSISDLIEIRQALGFFQKLEVLDIGIDKKAAARSTFHMAERRCRETNELFSSWSKGLFQMPRGVDSVLHAAQRKIQHVLGRVPAYNELDLRFGPGATTSVPRRKACSRVKLSTQLSCSTNLLSDLPDILREVPLWLNNLVEKFDLVVEPDGTTSLRELVTIEIHDGVLAFVPKNAKTYRSVMTEPTLNTLVQGGFGKWIGERLRRVGQDITDQTRNQRAARVGSLTGALATLDLSSASDTIASGLVEHLLPMDWFLALSKCRTGTVTDDGAVMHLQKFSSMGNGFTFPLQTLIFWALVTSCAGSDSDIQVYGDDIIVPVDSVPLILEVFNVCGFTINKGKSYWTGPFRESCGADYYRGISIRPFYLKKALSFERLFILHNHYVRNSDDEMASFVLSLIPEYLRLWGPDGYGDGHLIGDWSPVHHKREDGWGGYLFSTYTKIGNTHTRVLPGDRVLPAYSIYVRGSGDEPGVQKQKCRRTGVVLDPLPGTKGYKETRIYTLTCG